MKKLKPEDWILMAKCISENCFEKEKQQFLNLVQTHEGVRQNYKLMIYVYQMPIRVNTISDRTAFSQIDNEIKSSELIFEA